MVVEDEKSPNPFYIVPDLLEEILIRLPSKSILKFRTVSKQWRTILESRSFLERRMNNTQKHWKILVAYNGDRTRRLVDDEEIVYLHRDDEARPSMTCDGLVCFPEPDWIVVVNPFTGQLLRFPSRLGDTSSLDTHIWRGAEMTIFPGCRAMGFGRDKVTGLYKVVRMSFYPVEEEEDYECELLEVATGEWRKLSPPPYPVNVDRKSVCVNGSIYWLTIQEEYQILALDLHTLEFHEVSVPDTRVTCFKIQILNLDDRLAIAKTKDGHPGWKLKIWTMDKEEWSKTYSITLKIGPSWKLTWFTPLTVSKLGNLVFCDNHKRLFKYYTESGEIRCLSSDICVISPYLEDLVPLRSESVRTSRCRMLPEQGSNIFKWSSFGIPDIAFTLIVVGYICLRSLGVPCSVSTNFRN